YTPGVPGSGNNPTGYAENPGAYTSSVIACCLFQNSAWTQHSGSGTLYYQISPSIGASIFYQGSQTPQFDVEPAYQTIFTPPAGYAGSIAPGSYNFDLAQNGAIGPGLYKQHSTLIEEKV